MCVGYFRWRFLLRHVRVWPSHQSVCSGAGIIVRRHDDRFTTNCSIQAAMFGCAEQTPIAGQLCVFWPSPLWTYSKNVLMGSRSHHKGKYAPINGFIILIGLHTQLGRITKKILTAMAL